MAIDRAEAERIARLAKLRLKEEEIDDVAADLSALLDHFSIIGKEEVAGIEPLRVAPPATAPERKDHPRPSLSRDDALAGAPESEMGFFRTPRIID